jgi:hypothetical protein
MSRDDAINGNNFGEVWRYRLAYKNLVSTTTSSTTTAAAATDIQILALLFCQHFMGLKVQSTVLGACST